MLARTWWGATRVEDAERYLDGVPEEVVEREAAETSPA